MNSAVTGNVSLGVTSKSRAYWDLTLYFVVIACCAFGSTFLSQLLLGKEWSEAARWLGKCLLVMVSVCAATSYFLRRKGESWKQFRVELSGRAAADSLAGIILGILTASLWAAIVWVQAPFHLERNPKLNVMEIVMSIIATFAIGIGEESGYRSYGMKQARQAGGIAGALLIPTAIFVLMHFAGGMPLQAALLVVGSSSLLYCALMLVTRSLPLVAAFHIGNNLIQDWVLRPSSVSYWQVHFHDIDRAKNSALSIWWGIALVNLCAIALAVLVTRISGRNRTVVEACKKS